MGGEVAQHRKIRRSHLVQCEVATPTHREPGSSGGHRQRIHGLITGGQRCQHDGVQRCIVAG